MARHKQPEALAKLKGADKKDPQRYRKEVPKDSSPIGDAPEHMDAFAKEVWAELSSRALKGVLTGADRFIMEITTTLLAEYRIDPSEFAVGKYTHLIGCLARLGLTPSDRQKLGIDKQEEGNEFEDF